MAKFVKGNKLNAALEDIFEEAKEYLILISPYIKLHSRFKDELKKKIKDHKLEIAVVFGKNENDLSKSFNTEDLNFLLEFPNIKIGYEPRLHAKFYGNEKYGLMTSMNLYDYSQNNNIETGVLTTPSHFGIPGKNDLDEESFSYFEEVIENSTIIYHKVPEYEKNLLSKKYINSKIEVNCLDSYFKFNNAVEDTGNFSSKNIELNSLKENIVPTGYCIRTGIPIPFNPEKPFSYDGYKLWAEKKDKNCVEPFCHFTGEPSNGETSFSKPILSKNWNAAKKTFS